MTSLFQTKDLTTEIKTKIKNKNKIQLQKNLNTKLKLCKRYQALSNAIPKITMGENIHYVSMGSWSNHDLVNHLLQQIGPAEFLFCTWSVSDIAVKSILNNLKNGQVTKLTGVLDWRVKSYRPEIFSFMQFNIARLRITTCHAKCFVLINNNFQIAVVTSANFTNNPRIEAGVICCDEIAAKFHKNWILQEYEKSNPFSI